MRKIVLPFIIALASVGLYSCSEDFEVTAPYKHVTLVYGLLNIDDTAHYIRIQKAFLDENKNAIDMAKVSDSSYYRNMNVVLKELSGTTLVKTIPLVKVDLNLEGYQKDSGVFFNAPNYAYKFVDTALKPKTAGNSTTRYRLVIENPDLGFRDSSEIQLLDGGELEFSQPDFKEGYELNFASTGPNARLITQSVLPPDAKYLEAKITFRWVDRNTVTGAQTDRSADFFIYNGQSDNSRINANILNKDFYSFLQQAVGNAPANTERYLDSCDFSLAAAGPELYQYLLISRSQSSGLTADQLKPLYTNILGKDVYGIFSSRAYRVYKNIPLNNNTVDSLARNQITIGLNIKGRSDH